MTNAAIYPKKDWTLLVFMAGDNDMESFGDIDLVEMEAAPCDEHLHIVAQFDNRSEATYRYRIFPGGSELVGEPLGEVNTGDPALLTEFVVWGKKHFPAEKTALIIWNHGTGLRDLPPDFDYSSLRSGDTRAIKKELGRSLFTPSLVKLAHKQKRLRGIAIDATDRDYLDNKELQCALASVPGDGPRVDLIGFDACLMNVLEIAYQLRGLARVMVGSQENEPGVGWPYDKIVAEMSKPGITPHGLAETIVSLYTAETNMRKPKESPYTQSALDLEQVDTTYDLVCALVQKLAAPDVLSNGSIQRALRYVNKRVKRFQDRDLADLGDWCAIFRRWTKGRAGRSFRKELDALRDHLAKGEGLVFANQAHGGKDVKHIHGVSIYWPQESYSTVYDGLDFAESGWGRLAQKAVSLG